MVSSYVLFFILAGLGAYFRHFVSSSITPILGTLLVNVAGCYLMGVMVMMKNEGQIKTTFWFTIAVGFLGALTTFSGVIYDFIRLFEDKRYLLAVSYLLGTNLLGALAGLAGYKGLLYIPSK